MFVAFLLVEGPMFAYFFHDPDCGFIIFYPGYPPKKSPLTPNKNAIQTSPNIAKAPGIVCHGRQQRRQCHPLQQAAAPCEASPKV